MIKIGKVHKTKPHRFADIVEISAIINMAPVSEADMLSLIRMSGTPAAELMDVDQEDIDDDNYSDELTGAEITEIEQDYVCDCLIQLEYRVDQYGEAYPFVLEDDRLIVKEELSNTHRLYLFLLFASRSRTFTVRGFKNRIADKFEEVCKTALEKLMSPAAEVVMFGPNALDRTHRFNSDLRKAIPMLAEFMGAGLSNKFNPDEIAAQGDGQLDLIGVHTLDCSEGGWNVYLGQCAAHEDERSWSKKRFEAHPVNHRARFEFQVDPQGVMFIPVCFRRANGKWVNPNDATGIILMDRQRILFNVDNNDDCTNSVNEFLEIELQIYA